MSDVSQPMTRLSRRSLRERAAQMEAEAGTSTSPTPEASVEVAPEHGNSNALYDEATAARNQAISELDTAPTAAAPVSRVVRRSTTQMEPRRTQPPTPAVIQPGPVLHSDVAVAEVVTVSEVVEPVGPPVLPFAPVSSVVSEPNAPAVLLPGLRRGRRSLLALIPILAKLGWYRLRQKRGGMPSAVPKPHEYLHPAPVSHWCNT